MESFLDLHEHQDIYVICSGKSCDYIEPSFFDNKITIGINQVYKRFNCKYYVRKEINFIDEIIMNIDKNSKLFITKNGQTNDNNRKNIENLYKNRENVIFCENYKNIMKKTTSIKPENFCEEGIKKK